MAEESLIGESSAPTHRPDAGAAFSWPSGHRSTDAPFFGRQAELARLDAALRSAEQGTGSALLLVGPAGMGKTRLLDRLSDAARERGFEVRWSFGMRNAPTPLFPILQLFEGPPAPVDRAGREGGAQGTGRSASVAGRGAGAAPVDLTILGMIQALEDRSRSTPLLLILDDLQWADAESFRACRLLARHVRDWRVVLVGALRDDLLSEDGSSRDRAAELWDARRAGTLEWLPLAPLSAEDSRRLADALLGGEPTDRLRRARVRQVVARSGGNPYFLRETLREAFDPARTSAPEGREPPAPEGEAEEGVAVAPGTVPEPVRRLLVERLRRLDWRDRALLTVGAHLGMEFEAETVARALGRSAKEAMARLQRLASHRWPIHRSGPGARTFVFDHALLRDTLADPSEFPLGTRSAGTAAKLHTARRPDDAIVLAHLWGLAGEPDRAVRAYDQAVRHAIDHRATGLALALLDRMVDEIGSREGTIASLVRAGEEFTRSLDRSGTAGVAQRLARLVPEGPIAWQAEFWAIQADAPLDLAAAARRAEVLGDRLAGERGPEADSIRLQLAYLAAGVALWTESGAGPMRRVERTLKALEAAGRSFEYCRLAQMGIVIAANSRRSAEAARWLAACRRAMRRAGLERSVLRWYYEDCLAIVSWEQGDVRRALGALRKKIAFARALHAPLYEAEALVQCASFSLSTGRFAEAQRRATEGLEIARRMENAPISGAARMFLGWVALRSGAIDQAEEEFRQAVALLKGLRSPFHSGAQIGLALARAEHGDIERGWKEFTALTNQFRLAPNAMTPEFHRARARVAELAGHPKRARAELERALSCARSLRHPWDEVAVLQDLAAIERVHPDGRRPSWEVELDRVARRHGLDPEYSLRWDGLREINGPPSIGPVPPLRSAPERRGAPSPHRLVD